MFFPDSNRPRVIWGGHGGDHPSPHGPAEIGRRCPGGAGFPGRPARSGPHLTLGRIKTPRGLIGLAKAMEERARLGSGRVHRPGALPFQERPLAQGAVYTKLASYPSGRSAGGDDS